MWKMIFVRSTRKNAVHRVRAVKTTILMHEITLFTSLNDVLLPTGKNRFVTTTNTRGLSRVSVFVTELSTIFEI